MFTSFDLNPPAWDETKMGYIVYQQESCPNTNRLHWQGYVEFKRPTRFNSAKRSLGVNVHIEQRRGNAEEAVQYCTKEDTRVSEPVVFGGLSSSRQRPGSRSDLTALKNTLLANNDSLLSVYSKHFETCAKYSNFVKEFRSLIYKRDTIPEWRIVEVIVYWGDTGCGKTKRCYTEKPGLFKLPLGDQNQVWFDGYDYEDTVLLDEFYSQIKFNFLLQLLDGYPIRLPIKGSHVYAAWTTVYITSQYHPDDWYNTITPQLKQHLMRRLSKIEHITRGNNPNPDISRSAAPMRFPTLSLDSSDDEDEDIHFNEHLCANQEEIIDLTQ